MAAPFEGAGAPWAVCFPVLKGAPADAGGWGCDVLAAAADGAGAGLHGFCGCFVMSSGVMGGSWMPVFFSISARCLSIAF